MKIEDLLKSFPADQDQISINELRIILVKLIENLNENIIGDVVEFGCYRGKTSLFIARVLQEFSRKNNKNNAMKKLWIYDSFAGLPEKTKEDFSLSGMDFNRGELFVTKADVSRFFAKNNVPFPEIIKAWFSEIRENQLPDKISFAFFDGDFYESIRDSFMKTENRFSPGAIVIIDDYANEKLPGAAKAVNEWRKKNIEKIADFREEKSLAIIKLK